MRESGQDTPTPEFSETTEELFRVRQLAGTVALVLIRRVPSQARSKTLLPSSIRYFRENEDEYLSLSSEHSGYSGDDWSTLPLIEVMRSKTLNFKSKTTPI